MALKLMGKKKGMTQLFDKSGNVVPCTVIELEPNVVVQIKTKDNDGYDALQLAFDEITTEDPRTVVKRCGKPRKGHFDKASVAPRRVLKESKVENINDYTLGQAITTEAFNDIKFIDVMAMSIGKGYQGVMKLHNFAGGPASHGSGFHRHAGSTGMRSTPGRCFPGGKRASHMGYDRKTVQNLEIVQNIPEDNVIIVKGAVPGPKNGLVTLFSAVKKIGRNKKK